MNILAINPWIYDFAAFDFWLKPYGFLVILTYLKNKGIRVDYIDCLDKKSIYANFGRGKYPCEIIKKPGIFEEIPRHFKRYGISLNDFESKLKDKKYDYILITSSMTYWYPAIIDLIKIIRKKVPAVPIILGGTYAALCYNHAKETIDCDFVFKNASLPDFFKLLNIDFAAEDFFATFPLYEHFYAKVDYIVLRTSWGCPFNCSYCAIKELFTPLEKVHPDRDKSLTGFNGFFRIPHEKVMEFITKYYRNGVRNFVLYDDAFLYGPAYAKKLLTEIDKLKLDISFHTPNALHLKFLDEKIAFLLKKTGFINPHFGLETLQPDLQKLWGDKVTIEDLKKGINFLKKGGFKHGEFSVYLLLGYPDQNLEELKKEAETLHSLGAKISLAEFSPVPGTRLFENYKDSFSEPLLHNNSVFGFFHQDRIKEFWEIKNYVKRLNKAFL